MYSINCHSAGIRERFCIYLQVHCKFLFQSTVHVHVKIIPFSAHLKFLDCFSQCLDSLQVKMVSRLIKDEEIRPRENQAVPWMNQCVVQSNRNRLIIVNHTAFSQDTQGNVIGKC